MTDYERYSISWIDAFTLTNAYIVPTIAGSVIGPALPGLVLWLFVIVQFVYLFSISGKSDVEIERFINILSALLVQSVATIFFHLTERNAIEKLKEAASRAENVSVQKTSKKKSVFYF
jgi:hypothetical protein